MSENPPLAWVWQAFSAPVAAATAAKEAMDEAANVGARGPMAGEPPVANVPFPGMATWAVMVRHGARLAPPEGATEWPDGAAGARAIGF